MNRYLNAFTLSTALLYGANSAAAQETSTPPEAKAPESRPLASCESAFDAKLRLDTDMRSYEMLLQKSYGAVKAGDATATAVKPGLETAGKEIEAAYTALRKAISQCSIDVLALAEQKR